MKKLYFVFIIFLLFACSKDFLKSYDKRITGGQWYISNVDRFGIGLDAEGLAFREGTFVFERDGSLTYTDTQGNVSEGTWDIQKRRINDKTIRTFQVTAIDFNSQRVRSQFYDDMNFRGTNHFVGHVNTTFGSFVTHFRR
jgi:hypothetical protein